MHEYRKRIGISWQFPLLSIKLSANFRLVNQLSGAEPNFIFVSGSGLPIEVGSVSALLFFSFLTVAAQVSIFYIYTSFLHQD